MSCSHTVTRRLTACQSIPSIKARGSRAPEVGALPLPPTLVLPTMPLLLLANKIGAAAAQVSSPKRSPPRAMRQKCGGQSFSHMR